MFNKKYKYVKIEIELTRRCNKLCAHCLRGDAQDVTITKEIIDAVIEDVKECTHIYVGGGEPLLEPEMLFYLLDQVAKNLNTFALEITTNGSILNSAVVDALENFCNTPTSDRKTKRRVQLTISSDKYHNLGDCQKALAFYGPLFEAANKRLGCSEDEKQMLLETWSPIDEEQTAKKDSRPVLIYAGRGIELAKNEYSYIATKSLKVPSTNQHRLKIIDDIVYCTVGITAGGDVVLACENDSFESEDANASGNILNNSLSNIIDTHQESCLLTCAESNIVDSERTRVVYGKNGSRFEEAVSTQFLYLVAMKILDVRKTIKQAYPKLSASDIILGLPMPQSPLEACYYAKKIFESIPAHFDLKIDEYDKQLLKTRKRLSEDEREFLAWALSDVAYMQQADEEQLFRFFVKLFDAKIEELHKKHLKYSKHLAFANNGHVFACGSPDLFMCQDTRDMRFVK